MTTEPIFDRQLDGWIKDGPTEAPGQVLDGVLAAFPSTRQRRGALRLPWRNSRMNVFTRLLASATLVAFGAAVVVVIVRQTPGGIGGVGSTPPAAATPATPSIATAATPTPPTTPTPTAIESPGPCVPADLSARITLWEGAAGHRIAHVQMTNVCSDPCVIRTMAQPQLVDGSGSILIDGVPLGAPSVAQMIEPGAILSTLVQDGNYCGPVPMAPVTVAFVMPDGARVLAAPASPTDATVPPCLGAAGSAGDIEMHPWAP